MSASTFEEFARASARAPSFDRLLLAYYVEAMQSRVAEFSAEERVRVERLAGLGEHP
jgi:hypothetical protein